MPSVRTGPLIGLVSQVALLAALAAGIGVDGRGWAVGVACGIGTAVLLTRAMNRRGATSLTSADRVTLTRAVLVGGVAALTTQTPPSPSAVMTLVGLSWIALCLDLVDGRVARSTRSTSELGARFDLEVDAFLILVLSVYVAGMVGAWVLLIGGMRYGFVAAGQLWPWLRGDPPPRYWCKVVAATQGIILAASAADVLPREVTAAALVLSLGLLVESFGREVWWLWRHRSPAADHATGHATAHAGSRAASPTPGRRLGKVTAGMATALACALVWFALVGPDQLSGFSFGAFVRIPVEGLVVVAAALVLPPVARGSLAILVGLLLGLLTIVKILDMAFFEELDRPFNPIGDLGALRPAFGVLGDSVGRTAEVGLVVAAMALVLALLLLMPLALLRLTRLASRHRTGSVRAVTGLGLVWVLCTAFGVQLVSGAPIASRSAAVLAYDQVEQVRRAVRDRAVFAALVGHDRYRRTPGDRLLTGLRGKDVILAFVESYGRVAVQDSGFSPGVDAVLDTGTRKLKAAGFSAESAFLTSPTFGGISWLAHSTLQSGLWVDSQQRYDQLMSTHRLTLSTAFKRAGWRTVSDIPSNRASWPQGASFYRFDALYDRGNVGYHGPSFSYASMPDQYALSALRRDELANAGRPPVMAEIDLVSSHTPWTPIPHLVDWSQVGDGAIFDEMPEAGQPPEAVWPDSGRVQAAYGRSIEYTLRTLVSFVQTYPDDNLVLIVVGDHQPATIVSGSGAGHDVPITIIAHDRAVLDRISPWGWQDGMRPGPSAPVWPMSAFRNRFLAAYGG